MPAGAIDVMTTTMTPPTDSTPARTRLAEVIRGSKWLVLVVWLAAAIVATPLAEKLGDVERDDAASFLPGGFQSTQVAQMLEPDPDRPQALTAVVVYHRDGALTDADRAAIAADHHQVTSVGTPTAVQYSADGAAALFTVDFQPAGKDDDTVQRGVEGLRALVGKAPPAGLRVQVAGAAGLDVDNDAGDVDAALLLTSVAIVAVLLLLTYRSPLLWLVPLVAAVFAVQVARGVAYGLARGGLAVTELSTAILIVLVFGAATDYALLLLHRYREELAAYADRHEALAEALRRTAPALLASAATVSAGLLCLLFARLAGLAGLGPVAAAGIVVALLAMLTLLPAILAITGRWLLWPRAPRPGKPRGATTHRIWGRLANGVTRRPRPAAAAITLLLAAGALGLATLHTSADPLDKVPPGTESAAGQRIIADHFPPGISAPLTIVLPAGASTVDAVSAAKAAPHVAAAEPGEAVQGRPTLKVELDVDPYGAEAADTVRQLRGKLPDALVGGSPAVQMDYREAAVRDTWTVAPLVLAAVTIILGLLLHSLVAPLMLIATVVLSFVAALGVSSLVFTHGLGYGGVAGDLVIYVFVFLVALGVDYNIFLMERVREQHRHAPTTVAMRQGLAATGGVITAAGLVLAGTFSALAQLPDVTVAQVGIAVAIGVLIDAFIVRTILVPALVTLLGERTWWPNRLASPRSAQRGGSVR
jgi:putative drug exporter of the RND superfamily